MISWDYIIDLLPLNLVDLNLKGKSMMTNLIHKPKNN